MDIDLDYIMIWIYDIIREYTGLVVSCINQKHTQWFCWYLSMVPPLLVVLVVCGWTLDAKDSPIGPTKVQAVPMAMPKSHLVMTSSSPYRWPIEIDASPFLKIVDLSMAMINHQMVRHFFRNDPLATQRNCGNPKRTYSDLRLAAQRHVFQQGRIGDPVFGEGLRLVDWDGSTAKTLRPKWMDVWLIVFWWLERCMLHPVFGELHPNVFRYSSLQSQGYCGYRAVFIHIMLWIQLDSAGFDPKPLLFDGH